MLDGITEQRADLVGEKISSIHASRLKNLQAWLAEGVNPYRITRWVRTHKAAALQAQYAQLPNGEHTTDKVTVAGRIMLIRNSGMFIVLQDESGRIQSFNNVKALAPEALARLQRLDLGDIVGITGAIRRTPRGELTIDTESCTLLSKSLEPLPEKYHGIEDPDLEARERHKSIATDEEVKNRLVQRSKIVSAFRRTLEDQGFMEVETPILQPIAGGAAATPFVTHHNALDMQLYLRIAPELYHKRLIASGLTDKVFEIGRIFRNEGISYKHNPEFTSIEAYVAYANFEDMMVLIESLIRAAVKAVFGEGNSKFVYEGHEIETGGEWKKQSMVSLVAEHTGVDFMGVANAEDARAIAKRLGVEVLKSDGWGKVVEKIFGDKVEAKLIQPTHVTDLPAEISPLAKPNPNDPRLCERFETYIMGREIANAFSELNDPFVQHRYFKAQAEAKKAGDAEATSPDDDYVKVLEFGLPPTGGIGLGIDRLVMLLTGAHHIRQVILFPTLRMEANPRPSVSSIVDL